MKYTKHFTEATFFTAEDKDYADDCTGLGLSLYELEITPPNLIKPGTAQGVAPGLPTKSYEDFAVYPIDLSDNDERIGL